MPPLAAAAIIVFCEGLVLWSVFPILNFYCAELGVRETHILPWVGVLLMLQGGPKIISNPIFGRLSDRIGRGPLMAIASLGSVSASILWALAPNVYWLAASRAVAGIFGAQAVLASAVVADHAAPEKRGIGMGMIGAAFGLSMVLGPLYGGLVSEYLSFAAVGWIGAGIQSVAVLTAVTALSWKPVHQTVRVSGLVPSRSLWALPGVLPLLAATLFITLALAQVTTTFPEFSRKVYSFSPQQSGYAFAILGLIASLVQGGGLRLLLPAFGERRVALAGLLMVVVSMLGIAAQPQVVLLWLCLLLLGVGIALGTPTITSLISQCVDPQRQGAVLGLHQAATSLGRTLGAGLAGAAAALHHATAPYYAAAVLTLMGAVLLTQFRTPVARTVDGKPATETLLPE
ncbi:MAG: MFS transporter [Phycisphaerales bacterium]|nr:MFS transporter [Phycisphaerales bacterium]